MARDIDIVVKLRNETQQAFQQLQRQLDGVTRGTQASGQAARQATGPMSGMGVALDGVSIKSIAAATGIAGMGFAAADTGRQMVRTAIDFETAFAGVRKTVNASESQFAGLERGIRNMAMEMPATASEIAGIAEAAGQLGIQTGAILEFTKTMADLGVATNMTSEQAATSLARLANIVQMPQDQFDNLGSTVVALGNSLATTESELVDMGLRIAAAGDQVGLTEAQILGLAGALSSLGIEAEAGGTAMSRVLVDISNAAAMGGEKLAAFADVAGMSSDQFRTLFQQDAASAVAAFVEGLNRVSESGGNVFAVLEELGMSDIRVRDALLRMAGGGDILRESLELGTQAWEENIALTTEAEQRYQTTASQLQIIRNSLDDVAYSLFAAGEATGGTSIALEGMTANAQGIANVARSIEWVADAAASVPTVLPTWLQPDGGSGRIAAGWDSVGQSIRNAATIAAGGPLALAGVDWFPAGEDAAETFTLGFENGLSGFPQMVRDALAEIEMSQPFEVGPDGYGPHLDELILGPILSLQPRVREELQELFTMSPEVGASFASSISEMIGQGALSMEEGMSVLSGIPYDTLAPAMERLQSDLQGQLAEALVSGEDTNHIREQLSFVQGMLGETAEFVASSAIGFTEFATASEEAFGRVHDAALSLADVQGIVNDAVSTTAGNMSHWESSLNDIEKALEPLQQKMEDGIELSKEEAELYDTLTWGAERYAGGIENDLMPAFQDAVANSVEFTRRQDELNQMLEDGTISQEEHKDMMLDAALAGDDASLAAYGLAEAQGDVAEAINGVIDRIRDLLVELGLIPDEHTIKLNLDTSGARAAFDAFMSTVYSSNPTAEAGVGFTQRAGGGTIPPGGEFALVGEEGPELMMLPGGAHIYPHDETMRMLRGYATGTPDRPQLTDGERQAIRILGEMDVVITPESMAQADAELAALLDARAMAVELGLGDAIIAQLDEDIAAKQGELDLIGRIAGSAWGEGFLSELEAVDATEAMAGLLGDFSLEDIVSGKAGTDLGQQLVDLLQLEEIAKQMGDLDLAAMYREQADAVNAELQRLGQVMGTEFVQGQIDGYNAEQVAAEWDARLADALAGPQFGENIQSAIDEMNQKIDLGILMGAPMDVIAGWQAERDQLVEEGATYWKDVTEAIAAGAFSPEEIAAFAEAGGAAFMDAMEETFSPEAIEHILNPINEISEAGYDALMDMFGDAPELAEGFIDDIVAGLYDGTFDYEQAMALLGQAGSDALIPGLEAIEKQLTVDLVNAIIAGNAELEADILEKLALLDQLQGELDQTADAAERYARGSSGIYYNPATTGMGGAGSGGGGGMGGSGGGYGGPYVQSSGGGTFEDDYVFNIGPDTAWAQSDPQMYQFTVAGQTLQNKFGLDLSHEGGPDAFGSQAEYLYYIAERVNRHVQNYPHLIDNEEFWKHVQTMGNGWLTKDKILNISNLSVEDRGESIVYTEGKKDLGGLGAGRGTSPPTGGSGSGVRGFADGGVITSPLLGLIGEAGPEMVQPLKQGHPERERLIADIAESVLQAVNLKMGGGATFVIDGKVFSDVIGKRAMRGMGRVR